MTRSRSSLDALTEVRADGKVVTDRILPAVVIRFKVRKSFPEAQKKIQ